MKPLSTMTVHVGDPEFAAATSYALWSSALRGPHGRALALGQAEPAPTRPLPPYVGASINEYNQPYYHVLAEQRVPIGNALNSYEAAMSGWRVPSGSQQPEGIIIAGWRQGVQPALLAPGRQPLWHAIEAQRNGRAIAIIGDPLADSELAVLLGSSLPQLSRLASGHLSGTSIPAGSSWYVYSPPDAGWAAEPTVDQAEITNILGQMIRGLRWGSIVGGGVALGLLAVHAVRARRSP